MQTSASVFGAMPLSAPRTHHRSQQSLPMALNGRREGMAINRHRAPQKAALTRDAASRGGRSVLVRAAAAEEEEEASGDPPRRKEVRYVWREEEEEAAIQAERRDVEDLSGEKMESLESLFAPREDDVPADQMAELIGLGMWNLKGMLDPKLEVCAAYVESHLREYLATEIHLGPLPSEFRFSDSLQAVDKEKAKQYSPDSPAKGEPGYPRFLIENRVYGSRVFRKIHMELAHRQDGMQVFHFVMYPHENFDVPLFSLDMVSFNGNLTLAVCDMCPARMDMTIPPVYQQALVTIQQQFSMPRSSPEWGKSVFSDQCVLIRPSTPKEIGSFVQYVVSALTVHLKVTQLVNPIPTSDSARLADIKASHERYSTFMLKNDKTSKALEASFGAEFAKRYMREVMFDTASAAGV